MKIRYFPLFIAIPCGTAMADEKADAILESTLKYISGRTTLSTDTSITMKQSMPGQDPRENTVENSLLFKKDGPFALQAKGQAPSFAFVDGTAELNLPGGGLVQAKAESAAAATMSPDFGFDESSGSNPILDRDMAATLLRGMLFHSEKRPWDKKLENFAYDGEEDVDGVKTHRLAFEIEEETEGIKLPCKIWIDAGDKPLPRKLSVDMSPIVKMALEQNPQLKGLEISMSGAYANWKIDAEIPNEAFLLKVEDDGKPAKSVSELMSRGRQAPPSEALVGKAAPDFELELMDGSDFKVSDRKGKVLVLDFWATWCGPCIRALPILMSTVEEFEEDGVELVAVNLREDKETVEKFLGKKDWDLTVALDGEGKAGELYKVTGIPQTVIIGKDGKVMKVHVGANPATFKSELTRELKEAFGAK